MAMNELNRGSINFFDKCDRELDSPCWDVFMTVDASWFTNLLHGILRKQLHESDSREAREKG